LIDFTDGRPICPVGSEGDPQREECEAYAVRLAEDTGRPGRTWTRDDRFCTCPDSYCENSPHNQYKLLVYCGGLYKACARKRVCQEFNTNKDLHLDRCAAPPPAYW
jgi:hypothetical protein